MRVTGLGPVADCPLLGNLNREADNITDKPPRLKLTRSYLDVPLAQAAWPLRAVAKARLQIPHGGDDFPFALPAGQVQRIASRNNTGTSGLWIGVDSSALTGSLLKRETSLPDVNVRLLRGKAVEYYLNDHTLAEMHAWVMRLEQHRDFSSKDDWKCAQFMSGKHRVGAE